MEGENYKLVNFGKYCPPRANLFAHLYESVCAVVYANLFARVAKMGYNI